MEAVDFADEIYIQGVSKLKEELVQACLIPEGERRVIDPRYLEQQEIEGDSIDDVKRENKLVHVFKNNLGLKSNKISANLKKITSFFNKKT